MTTGLDDLIARLEAASEGSQELDALIWAVVLSRNPIAIDGYGEPPETAWYEYEVVEGRADGVIDMFVVWPNGRRVRRAARRATKFTTSLDAALTLVPKGYDYGFSFSKQHGLETWVQKPFKQSECFQGYAPDGDMTDKTMAKAMSIAALKARDEP